MAKLRGIYEKVTDSGIWWVRWTDAQGKLHREKAGRKSDAKTLVDKRRTETLQQKKLPEQFRLKVTFGCLCDDAIMIEVKAAEGFQQSLHGVRPASRCQAMQASAHGDPFGIQRGLSAVAAAAPGPPRPCTQAALSREHLKTPKAPR